MARISLKVKNGASLVFASVASIAWGFASRRYDAKSSWLPAAGVGAFFLLFQLGLLFIPSKEEEELSSLRKRRDEEEARVAVEKAELAAQKSRDQARRDKEADQISLRIRQEVASGNTEAVIQLIKIRTEHYGK